jgi:hypothetical protein
MAADSRGDLNDTQPGCCLGFRRMTSARAAKMTSFMLGRSARHAATNPCERSPPSASSSASSNSRAA